MRPAAPRYIVAPESMGMIAFEALHARKEAARAALLAAYVAGDQAAIDAAMTTLREWCTARGFKERRKGRGK
jgi:hypothetical protein